MIYKNLLPANEENIKKAAKVIREGGIVAFPTETVYGLGADALNSRSVARIFEVKNRPRFDPLIVHVCSIEMARDVVARVDELSFALMKRFWPGPLTLVLPKKKFVPDITTAGLKTVAIRMPDHPVALRLVELSGKPIAAPSANPFGYISPTSAEQVAEMLNYKVDIILDGGKTPFGIESTVIMVKEGKIYLLRPGALPVEKIEEYTGLKVEDIESSKPISPGMIKKHYAPKTRAFLLTSWEEYFKVRSMLGSVGLVLKDRKIIYGFKDVLHLSDEGDTYEMAANLFKTMYKVDGMGWKAVFFQGVEEKGLGRAIMNRLKKATGN